MSRSQTEFLKKIVTISEFSSTSGAKRKNCSAPLPILSPTFMNEIRTDMPISGASSPSTAIANKNHDTSLIISIFQVFPYLQTSKTLPALK